MPGRFQHLQAHASEIENIAVAKRAESVCGFGRSPQTYRCAHTIAQLQVAGDKIGV